MGTRRLSIVPSNSPVLAFLSEHGGEGLPAPMGKPGMVAQDEWQAPFDEFACEAVKPRSPEIVQS